MGDGVGEIGNGICPLAHILPNGAIGIGEDVGGIAFRRDDFALPVADNFDGERFVLEMAAVCGDNDLPVLAFDFHAQAAAAAAIGDIQQAAVLGLSLKEDVVDGGAGDRFAGIFADDFGVLAGGQGVHVVQRAKDGL